MQQTAKYKFNQPSIDDLISPTPLNENMDKVETALEALNGQVTATNNRVTATDNRVTATDNRVTAIGNRVTANENGITAVNSRVTAVDGRVTAVDGRVTATDNRVTAVDGRRVLDHLVTATAPGGATEFTVNLTPFNPSQYGALVMVYAQEEGTQPLQVKINSSAEAMSLIAKGSGTSIYSRYYGGGLGLLIPCLERIFGVAMSGGLLPGSHSATTYGVFKTIPWRDVATLLFTSVGDYARVSIYGLRI